jgi:hypothetical protein
MPAAVSGGAAAEIRSTESGFLESVGLMEITRAPLDHRATVREARSNADAAFHIPASTTATPLKPSTTGTTPMGSFTVRGSSRRNEGTANASVAPAATTSGLTRRVKSKSAARLAEYCSP